MNLSASNRLSYLFLFQNMLTRMCSRLRILCKHVQPRKKQQYYVHKKGCHRALIYSAVSRAFCIKCASQCWKCSFEIQNSSLFCSQCSTLQKPDENKNYFDVLGIEQSFEIKDKELTTKYRKMQNVLHPDRFSTRNVVRNSNLIIFYILLCWPTRSVYVHRARLKTDDAFVAAFQASGSILHLVFQC
jgi:hypothetical protein